MSVTGDVFGYFTLTLPTNTCDYGGWGTAARQAATAAGVDLAAYTNVVHAFPRQSSCPWGGLGQLPGKYSWINGSMSLYVTSHELGHNFGAHHASTMRCTASGVRVPLSSSCTVDEYGDPFDVMGTSAQRHVQSWHRRQLGFLGTTDQLTVTQSGRYTVATAQVGGGTPRIVRIARPSGDFYYLEFRQPFGLYDNFTATAAAVNGVMVRVAPDVKRLQSRLLDMNPSTTTFSDAALLVGQTFTDTASGISVTTVAVGTTGATVRVQFGPDTVPPSPVGQLAATTSAASDVNLTWAAATDNLEVAAYQVTRDAVVLGTTRDTTWNDAGLAQGVTYGYSVVALDGAGNASTPQSVVHHLPDSTAPSGPASLTAVQTGPRSLTVSWDAATDNVGVSGYEVTRNGSVITTTTATTVDHSDLLDGRAYEYSVRALDAAGNRGAAATGLVTLPDVTPPGAIGSFAAAASSTTATRLTWQPAADNVSVAGYRVLRDAAVVATLPADATGHAESNLPSDRTYQYSVSAFDAAGNHGPESVASVRLVSVDTLAPTVPQALKGTPLGSRRIGLTWTASTDDRAGIWYKVFRNDVLIATVTTTSYTDQPATVAWYRYKVRAVDAAGNRSAFTPSITVKAKRYA
jgi:chitodextrinase